MTPAARPRVRSNHEIPTILQDGIATSRTQHAMNHQTITTTLLSAALLGIASAGTEADALDGSFGAKEETFFDRFTFGSYGELHGRAGDGEDNIDAHRLVLLTDFQVSKRIKFVSELEFEHVYYRGQSGGEKDEVTEVEQAYFEFTLRDDLLLNAGIQLIPVGIINPTHEPTTFYGVERPNVEKYIIPSTWWEGALGIVKTYESGFQLDVMAHSALDMKSDGYIRSGRPKLHLSDYQDTHSWGLTSRVKYTGIAGLELAGALQYQDDTSSTISGKQSTILAETHAIYRKGNFEIRALAAYWDVDGYSNSDANNQWGYYIEPSYAVDMPKGKAGVFARFSQYEYFNGTRRDQKEFSVGVNYWPIEEVVLKTDYTNIDKGGEHDETYNFGIGYYF